MFLFDDKTESYERIQLIWDASQITAIKKWNTATKQYRSTNVVCVHRHLCLLHMSLSTMLYKNASAHTQRESRNPNNIVFVLSQFSTSTIQIGKHKTKMYVHSMSTCKYKYKYFGTAFHPSIAFILFMFSHFGNCVFTVCIYIFTWVKIACSAAPPVTPANYSRWHIFVGILRSKRIWSILSIQLAAPLSASAPQRK